jgi:hypothetical protein
MAKGARVLKFKEQRPKVLEFGNALQRFPSAWRLQEAEKGDNAEEMVICLSLTRKEECSVLG